MDESNPALKKRQWAEGGRGFESGPESFLFSWSSGFLLGGMGSNPIRKTIFYYIGLGIFGWRRGFEFESISDFFFVVLV